MKDILVLLLIVGGAYIMIQLMQKKTIIPWRESKLKDDKKVEPEKKNKKM